MFLLYRVEGVCPCLPGGVGRAQLQCTVPGVDVRVWRERRPRLQVSLGVSKLLPHLDCSNLFRCSAWPISTSTSLSRATSRRPQICQSGSQRGSPLFFFQLENADSPDSKCFCRDSRSGVLYHIRVRHTTIPSALFCRLQRDALFSGSGCLPDCRRSLGMK